MRQSSAPLSAQNAVIVKKNVKLCFLIKNKNNLKKNPKFQIFRKLETWLE